METGHSSVAFTNDSAEPPTPEMVISFTCLSSTLSSRPFDLTGDILEINPCGLEYRPRLIQGFRLALFISALLEGLRIGFTAWPIAGQLALESSSPHRPGREGALRYREQCEEPRMSSPCPPSPTPFRGPVSTKCVQLKLDTGCAPVLLTSDRRKLNKKPNALIRKGEKRN